MLPPKQLLNQPTLTFNNKSTNQRLTANFGLIWLLWHVAFVQVYLSKVDPIVCRVGGAEGK